jgi:hypothetical protein
MGTPRQLWLVVLFATACGDPAYHPQPAQEPALWTGTGVAPPPTAAPAPAVTTPCAISFAPIPTGVCDAVAEGPDARPDRVGVQGTFALHTDCDRVTLIADEQGHQVDHGGSTVEVTIDLYEGPNILYATASEPGTSRRGRTPEFVFDVDAIGPELRPSFPEDGDILTPTTPGIVQTDDQFDVPVRFTLAGAVHATLSVDGDEPVPTQTQGIVETSVRVAAGEHSVTLVAIDRCGNMTERTVGFTMDHHIAELQITAPASGSNLGTLDDADTELDGIQVDFIVVASGLDGEVQIACRPAVAPDFEHHSPPVATRQTPFAVPMTMPEGPFACRAEHFGLNTVSDEVEVAVNYAEVPDPPQFVSPRHGDEVHAEQVDVEVSASVENGTLASLVVSGGIPRFTVARGGTFLWNDVALLPGANVVTAEIEGESAATIRATFHRTP